VKAAKGAPSTDADGGARPIAQFFIPASASLQERRPRTLKHGDSFAVYDHNGDVLSGPGSPEGLYHRDTRHLSHLYMTINGARPMLLSSSLRDDNAALFCDLTNPDIHGDNDVVVIKHDRIHMRRVRVLWNAAARERLTIHNFDDRPHKLQLAFAFAADFVDVFEVRGSHRERRGQSAPPVVARDCVTFRYDGLDDEKRETRLCFDPSPSLLTAERAEFAVELGAGETCTFFIDVACNAETPFVSPKRAFFSSYRGARRALRAAKRRAVTIQTSNNILNEAIERSLSDLYMLVSDTPEGPYPYAGIPWFSTVFGRDGIITAMQALWLDPNIARGVLRHLAANQATALDDFADAEPGKILHEIRHGEMAELGEVPFRRYYGSVDSTPLFVMLAGAYLERTGDMAVIREIWPNVEAALRWIDEYGDRDRDGFVEYGRRTESGLANQGWKDSHDSVFHADGAFARAPIALAEVQAYVYGAWAAAAAMAQRLGHMERSAQLTSRAEALRRRFDDHFFDEELRTYVLALDGDKKPCRVRSSNAGHVLFTGLAMPERAAPVVETLMSAASFSGFGVRTIAMTERRYNPMSYHNGSVWPHDTTLIAAGFARYGFRHEAARLFEALFAASTHMDLRRLPELFCGFARQGGAGPVFYPVACAPQAWATGALPYMLQVCLGLHFSPQDRVVHLDHPILPEFVDDVVLRRLSVSGGSLDLTLKRADSHVLVHVSERHGACRVETTL
jgi:glycogen debranching enzyme